MTDSIAHFTFYRAIHGTVTVGGNISLPKLGISLIQLQCLLPDDSTSHVRLYDILHIPQLGHSLFSWNAVRNRGFTMEATYNHIYLYNTKNEIVLHVVFKGNLPYLVLVQP